MQTRRFGKLDWKVSALGFGAMRLPLASKESSAIDEPAATKMLHFAIEQGVNYVDTAYPYHGGQSEIFVGKALQQGYRQRVRLATKLPTWLVKETPDFDKYLNEQLGKLQVDQIDFYLLHALNKNSWEKIEALGVLDWAEKAIADGRIGHLGFSFHDDYDAFKTIVNAYGNWTFCQIQYNYMDIKNQARSEGLRYAASRGLAVVIMEPLLGGRLVNPPGPVQTLWNTATTPRAAADWALQWLWDQPEVSVVLSGMSNLQQVEENVASAAVSGIGTLTQAELELIDQVREKYNELAPIPCTKCEYCLPCPNGVNIPGNFEIYNEAIMYEKLESARHAYRHWFPEEQHADKCLACLECEAKCPQHIPITEWLPRVHALMSEAA